MYHTTGLCREFIADLRATIHHETADKKEGVATYLGSAQAGGRDTRGICAEMASRRNQRRLTVYPSRRLAARSRQ